MGTKSTRKTRPNNRKKVGGNARPKQTATRPRRPYVKALLVFLAISVAYLAYLDVRIISKFEGRIWQLPARVYARPLELYEGMSLKPEQLLVELGTLNYSEDSSGTLQLGQFHRSYSRFDIVTRGFEYWDGVEPS